MKNKLYRAVIIAFVATVAVFVLFAGWRALQHNDTPEFSCDGDTFTASIHEGDAGLLRGVTATDREDGDLTDRIFIESVSRFTTPGTSRVTYAVQDSDGQVAKIQRTVTYTDYQSPHFALSAPLKFPFTGVIDPTDYLSATDCVDGDLTASIHASLLGSSSTITSTGDWEVQFRVTNSLGDTSYLTTVIVVEDLTTTQKTHTPQITLTDYLVYLPKGQTFDPMSYLDTVSVQAADAPDTPDTLRERVSVNSPVDVNTSGCYTVTYTCQSQEGYTGRVNLVVVVE